MMMHFFAVVFADELDHMLDHFKGGIPVVAVFAAAPEHGVDNQAFPGQVQGLKALHLFIRRLHPMALLGLMVVHYHGVHSQANDLGLPNFQPPQEQLLQQVAKQPDAAPGEGAQKPLDCMGGEHLCRSTHRPNPLGCRPCLA